MNKAARTERLDGLLAGMGYGARSAIKQLAKAGAITLDGVRLTAADQRLALTPDLADRMRVNDQPLDPLPGMVVMLHKPLGFSCSHKESGKLVYELFPDRWQWRKPALSSIGRLDKETTGLLLLTDDGDFLHRVIAPRSEVTKRYHVTLARPLNGTERNIFARGDMMLTGESKPLLPVTLDMLSPTTAYVTLNEGRYHQIRRMFAAMDNEVVGLHRERIGALALPDDLAPSDYRLLAPPQIAMITSKW